MSIDFIDDDITAQHVADADVDIKTMTSACGQINDYCTNALPKMMFTLPTQAEGTAFQKKVWAELLTIPAGEVVTYGELARRLKSSPRAVGNACRRNPVPIVIPCHRVVAKHHRGGYSGDTSGRMLDIKNWLLHHEGAI